MSGPYTEDAETWIVLDTIRDHIIDTGCEVPEEKIFLARPNQAFIGEGPIICIYPETPDRDKWTGDSNFWTGSLTTDNISVDVLVDDIYNDARNQEALRSQLRIKAFLERTLYGSFVVLPQKMSDNGVEYIESYKPNNGEDYKIETEQGIMVGTVVPISVRRREDWTKVPRNWIVAKHHVDFDVDKDGNPERELVIDES